MNVRINRGRELEERAKIAAMQRDNRIERITQAKIADSEAANQLALDRLKFDKNVHRDDLGQKQLQRMHETDLSKSNQIHESQLQEGQLGALSSENEKDRSFKRGENFLAREHDYGMQENRLDSTEGLALQKNQVDTQNKAYQRALDRLKNTPRYKSEADKELGNENPDYTRALKNYSQFFANKKAGGAFVSSILGKTPEQPANSEVDNTGATPRRYLGPQMPVEESPKPRHVAPRQYLSSDPIMQVDGVYTNLPQRSLSNNQEQVSQEPITVNPYPNHFGRRVMASSNRQTSTQQQNAPVRVTQTSLDSWKQKKKALEYERLLRRMDR